jgi:hypothetical protein
VDIRLACSRTGAVATLRLSHSGALLRAVSAARPETGTMSVLEDHLGVYLDRGWRWGRTVYATPDDLARVLLDHVRRRLDVVAENGPAGIPSRAVLSAARIPVFRLPRARPVLTARRVPGAGSGRL